MKIIRTVACCLMLCPLLFGCVDYDLSIRFDSQTHGEITQTIHLSDRLLALNETEVFDSFATRAKALSGKARRLDTDTLKITIPFSNGAQLVERFNAFYSHDDSSFALLSELTGAPDIDAHLALTQQNFFFALRNTLTYDLSLDRVNMLNIGRGLNDLSWLNLDFHLITPWGLVDDADLTRADWHLSPDQPHRIQATFWVPSPIGIGAGIIAILCTLGYLLKHKLLSKPTAV